MIARLTRRLLASAVVLLGMSAAVYGLMGLMPGDPIDLMVAADPTLTAADAARLKALQGLDRPWTARYADWLAAVRSGDLGYSRLHGAPVVEVLGPALGRSLVLMILALSLAFLIAVPLGLGAALRPRSGLDYAANLVAFGGISVPTFWLGLMLIALFSVRLDWLPAGGIATVGDGSLGDRAAHLVLPVVALSVTSVGQYTRYIRASVMETAREAFVRTARAKGLSWPATVARHVLRNAMIPVMTVLALDFGMVFSGALITETVFGYPGMGKTIFDAVMGNDYNLAMTGFLLATAVTLIGNGLADVGYGLIDPRTAEEHRA